jgi:hypothetical protein
VFHRTEKMQDPRLELETVIVKYTRALGSDFQGDILQVSHLTRKTSRSAVEVVLAGLRDV